MQQRPCVLQLHREWVRWAQAGALRSDTRIAIVVRAFMCEPFFIGAFHEIPILFAA